MIAGYETWREIDVREVGMTGLLEFQINAATDIMLSSDSTLDTEEKLRVMVMGQELIAAANRLNWAEVGNVEEFTLKASFIKKIADSLAHSIAGAGYISQFEDPDGVAVTDMTTIQIAKVRILRPKEGQ